MTAYNSHFEWDRPRLGPGQPALLSRTSTSSYVPNTIYYESLREPAELQGYLNRCPPTLTILQISSARIESIVGVRFPENLTEINLNSNRIRTLAGVQFPQTLTILNLSYNSIESLAGVQFPQTLTTLNLSNNFIKALDRIQFPPNLTVLLLNDNNITTMSGVQFPNGLITLNLSNSDERGDARGGYGYNQIKSFNDVRFPPTLTELDLARNRLETVGRIIDPTPGILTLIEHQFPKVVEQYRQTVSRQSQQAERATSKEITDFNQLSLHNKLHAITSFLREGMEARAQANIDRLEGNCNVIYVKLITNGVRYPVPMIPTENIQYILDYMNENYYISSLVPNCGAMHLYKSDTRGRLELTRSLADLGVSTGDTLNAQCRIMQLAGGRGFQKEKNKDHKKRWSMKYKRSINCRRPRGFSQRQHCKYGRRGRKTLGSRARATRRK